MGRAMRLAPVVLATLVACDRVPASAVTRCESEVKVGAARTDVLFVIDDSGSMSEEQAAMRDSLYAFIQGLAASGIQNDFQIGVTTTSVAGFDGGTTFTFGGVPYPAGRLVAVDPGALTDPTLVGKLLYGPPPAGFVGPRILSSTSPTLQADFEANVLVGIAGSGKEQPFRAARLALEATGPGAPNEGFVRDGARLAVVFLSDEDDCSESASPGTVTSNDACHDPAIKASALDPVGELVSVLDGPIAGEVHQIVVAVIAGYDRTTLAPTGCATSYDVPTRYDALLDALGPTRTIRASICEPRFEGALAAIADQLVPQVVPLEGTPPDWRMLVATVTTAAGDVVPCPIAAAGTPEAASAGAVYTPPLAGPATVTFQGACTLHRLDQVDLRLVCAG